MCETLATLQVKASKNSTPRHRITVKTKIIVQGGNASGINNSVV